MDFPSSYADRDEIENLFALQKHTAKRLRQRTAPEKIRQLNRLKGWITTNKDKIRNALKSDLGKPSLEADISEIYVVLSEINFTIKNLAKWMKPKKVRRHISFVGSNSQIRYEPKGCSLIISPWNYPFNLAIGPLVSALAAGCTVLLKPSEMAVHTSKLIAEMISALFKKDEVAVVEGGIPVAKILLSLPFDHIFFTGSPRVGQEIMKSAAEHLTSLTLELGGKSPALIDKGCNLSEVAERLVWGKFLNCGQTCVAPDFLLVHEGDLESLVLAMKKAIIRMFDGKDKGILYSPDYGRIINQDHLKRLEGLLSDGLAKGAKVEFGGKIEPDQSFMEPTIMTLVGPNMRLMEEEIFGPILPVLTYTELNQAVDYLNSKPKPLAMYLFSEETFFSEYILKHTSSGTAVINDCVLHFGHPGLPFGGINHSGMGKAHGHFGFLAFSNEKAVLKQKTGLIPGRMLYPPYGLKKNKIIQFLMKWV